ncbi:MAG: hypothetical protein QNK04_15105 [Myxococcota bacterium]|nr:hypothetical protein [Myxococcota bacterium]
MTEATLPTTGRPPQPVPAPLLLAAFGILIVLLFGFGVAAGARGWDVAVLALALLTGFVALVPLALDWSRPPEKRQLLITLVVMAYALFLVVPIFTRYFLVIEKSDRIFDLGNQAAQDVVFAQVLTLAGLISMLAGFYLPIGTALTSVVPKPAREWSIQECFAVGAVMIPLGYAVYYGGQFGLIPRVAGTGVFGAIAIWYLLGVGLMTLTYLRHRSQVALLAAVALIIPATIFNFFTGSKKLMLSPLLMFVLAHLVVERRIRTTWVVAGFAAIVMLYPVAQFYRDVVQSSNRLVAVQVLANPGRLIAHISYFFNNVEPGEYFRAGVLSATERLNGLGVTSVILRDTPDRVPYQNGWSLGYIPLAYVPRILWQDKPDLNVGQFVTDNYGSGVERTHTAPTWIGELYFNFGTIGVLGGLFVFGILFRVLQELFFRPWAPIPALLVAILVVNTVPLHVESNIQGTINGVIFNCTPILLVHFVVRLLGGRGSPVARPAAAPG